MKKIPEPDIDFGIINEIILQPIRSVVLRAGLDIGIFDVLSDFISSSEVSRRLNTHPTNTRHLLDGLASCDLVEKKNQLYRNAEISRIYLASDSPNFLGPLIHHYQRSLIDVLGDLSERVRKGSGSPSPSIADRSHDEFKEYAESLAGSAMGGTAKIAVRIVAQQPEFPDMRRMLDIGGGPGIVAMAIVDSHPSMRGVIFELPSMAEIARQNVSDFGMVDRIEVVSGNFLTDTLDGSFDLIWSSFCLYFTKHDLEGAARKIFEALEPDGIFISMHEGLRDERTKPELFVLPCIAHNMMGHPMAFEYGEIAEAMRRVGFSDVTSRSEETPFGEVELVTGRKE